jgi:tetratricopeptide (TPR) repeat protein
MIVDRINLSFAGVFAMPPNDRFTALRKNISLPLSRAQQMILRGDYAGAEAVYKDALKQWRSAAAPKAEEDQFIISLGKCYEAQRKYEDAYALYMEALNHLTGTSYDNVYTSFLYLNERMGTFVTKAPNNLRDE